MDFEQLQERLVGLWASIGTWSEDDQTIVVIPSVSLDLELLQEYADLVSAYEERFLFLLFLLRQQHARLIYVTSQSIPPSVIDYYLALIPGVDAQEAFSPRVA